jgi:hypothetical protein
MNRFHLLAAAAVLILGLAACGGASTTSSPPASHPPASGATSAAAGSPASAQPPGTQVIHYTPWTAPGTLASGFSAASTQSGSCFTDSIASGEPDAFRCSVGNVLYDPCFADGSSGPGPVFCPNPQDPDSGTIINLTSSLPAPNSAPGSVLPWLLVLADGHSCAAITGTVGTLGGKNGYYGCASGSTLYGYAYGDPDESSATWTIYYAPSGATASGMTQVNITTAYE